MTREQCYVNCTFWFVNSGNDTTVTVGFPNYFYTPGADSKPLSAFTCLVNGHPLKVEEKKEIEIVDSIDEIGRYWFSWECQFKHDDTTVIENSYVGAWGASNIGSKDFEYMLGTGGSWYGPIGQGTIIFDHSGVATSLFFSFLYDTAQMHLTQYEDSAIFEFKNLSPKTNQRIEASVYCFWSDPYEDDGSIPLSSNTRYADWGFTEFFKNQNMTPDSGRAMINEIYAREGCIFGEDSLQKRFSATTWYKPDSSFTDKKLNKYEIAAIDRIKKCFIDRVK